MTNQEIARITQAIGETEAILNKAKKYSPEFQDKKLIASMEKHKQKLIDMIANKKMPSVWIR